MASGRPEVLKEGGDFIVIALGSMVAPAEEAVNLLEKEGLSGGLLNARFVKPIDEKYLRQLVGAAPRVFTVEEGIINGGFGFAVSQALGRPLVTLGLPCAFIPHDDKDESVFVLVTTEDGERTGVFVIRGYMLGGLAKREEWKTTHGGYAGAYFVPHSFLRPIQDLLP